MTHEQAGAHADKEHSHSCLIAAVLFMLLGGLCSTTSTKLRRLEQRVADLEQAQRQPE